MNLRRKVIATDIPLGMKDEPLHFNLHTFTFANNDKTVVGYLRWIPKLISSDERNKGRIREIDNFQSTNNVKPIPLTTERSIHERTDDEEEFTDEEVDTRDYDNDFDNGNENGNHNRNRNRNHNPNENDNYSDSDIDNDNDNNRSNDDENDNNRSNDDENDNHNHNDSHNRNRNHHHNENDNDNHDDTDNDNSNENASMATKKKVCLPSESFAASKISIYSCPEVFLMVKIRNQLRHVGYDISRKIMKRDVSTT
ncbi:unnamed protein product [Rotaria sp. Silwood2]|nr:unnamed protein product [Rotaria sp. Silwood2]